MDPRMRKPLGFLVVASVCLARALPAVAEPLEVKSVMVDSQLMKLPGIPLQGIDFNSLSYQYAVRGATVIETQIQQERIDCDGEPAVHEYLNVRYQGPDVLFRIADKRRNKVLLLRKLDTSGEEAFGRGQCDMDDAMQAFERQRGPWQAGLEKRLLTEARAEMATFIERDVAPSYETVRFPLFYVRGASDGFASFNVAFDQAREAFDWHARYGMTLEAEQNLLLAITTWEGQLEALEVPGADANVVRERLSLILHRNLSVSYLFIHDYANARKHDAMAISFGMPKTGSLQSLILAHERHHILSPQVSQDMVLLANLYRVGRSAVMAAELEKVPDYAALSRELAQAD